MAFNSEYSQMAFNSEYSQIMHMQNLYECAIFHSLTSFNFIYL